MTDNVTDWRAEQMEIAGQRYEVVTKYGRRGGLVRIG